ncbi:15065_t:CDS:2 [Dentiscutata erythropus]|uniref:15065_t:CDS:1 n=1 Tax=Dentiscutata erythropus TaxID=1348616 RepID=A0A9N9CAJ6_9GLOM|nr:15065_t:CDS:2 [Dentiscutata erythropus]
MRITTSEDPRQPARQHMLSFISEENLRFIPDFSNLSAERIPHQNTNSQRNNSLTKIRQNLSAYFLNFRQKISRTLQGENGLCPDCNQINTYEDWCQTYNAKRFQQNFSSWTS